MRSTRRAPGRATTILAMALVGVTIFTGLSSGATNPLTKKRALKLFYTKAQADQRFLDGAEGGALFLDASEANAMLLDQGEGDVRYVQEDETKVGTFTCPARAFTAASAASYVFSDGLLYSTNLSGASCPIDLPDGAEVTSFTATVHDFDNVREVDCALRRYDLIPPIAAPDTLAEAGTTTIGTLGDIQVTDSSISTPVINNAAWGYTVDCDLGFDQAIGIYGVVVDFTVTGGLGAAA